MAKSSQAELTFRVIVLGIVLSVVMGAANVYLGLRVGITVTASVPAAVVSMLILRRILRTGTILESNQVQTAASAGESLAAGIIFTLPALVMIGVWGEFDFWMTTGIAIAGGVLGILFMIPMREVFIKGNKELPYPEGVVCAEVLKTGEQGEASAAEGRLILEGGLLGALVKFGESGLGILRGTLEGAFFAGGRVWFMGMDALPALIAVGFIIRLVVASNVFIGGCLAWLVALPLLSSGEIAEGLDPVDLAYGIWSSEIRYLGVGAMLVGGFTTIWQVRGGLVSAVRILLGRGDRVLNDADRSLSPQTIVIWSVIAIVLTGGLYLQLIDNIGLVVLITVIMVIAGFFFTAVASYIVGLVGNSNCPVSGMTITSVLLAGLLLLAFGYEGTEGMLATLGVAAVVCCIACTSGDVCNDLKTGELVGATPYKQQIMQIIGVVTAAFVMAPVLQILHEGTEGGIGGPALPAPQAQLFASLAEGFFGEGNIRWDMVAIGGIMGLILMGVDTLLKAKGFAMRIYLMPTAVGMYLPLGMSVPIFLGGLIAWLVGRRAPQEPRAHHRGMLFASGLIAGESLLGVGIALLAVLGLNIHFSNTAPWLSLLLTVGVLSWICYRMFHGSCKRAKVAPK